MEKDFSSCARCSIKIPERFCQNDQGRSPSFCPTANDDDIIANALEELKDPVVYKFLQTASIQEGEGYTDKELGYQQTRPLKPRIVEIMEFAQKMNYTRLGLAFCMGLVREAKTVDRILVSNGFEVVSSVCKIGREPKEKLEIEEHQKIRVGEFESMCNPIAQAFILNQARTEFNVMMGLCVGHDSMFLKYAEAPCTVLAVKDRLLGHNPLAAIYTAESYYRSLTKE